MTKLLQCLRDELVRRDYAATTIRSSIQIVAAFRQHAGTRLDRLTPAHLRRYHLYLLEERRLAVGTVVTQICALRFFCRYVLKRRDVREDLPYPKQRLRLPVVLSPTRSSVLSQGADGSFASGGLGRGRRIVRLGLSADSSRERAPPRRW